MHIEEDRTRMIFKYENNGKINYKIGLSKKDKDGKYLNGYMLCRLPKDASLENKTQIKLIDAWIDFYIKDKITYPYLFINKYEIIESGKVVYERQDVPQDVPQNIKSDYDNLDKGVQLKDSDLPF